MRTANVLTVKVRARIARKHVFALRLWLGVKLIELGCRVASTKVTIYTEVEQ